MTDRQGHMQEPPFTTPTEIAPTQLYPITTIDAMAHPILTHLNADTSWLIQIPVPSETRQKKYFTLLLDPWLVGPQTDVHWLFSTQWHVVPSVVDSLGRLAEVDTTGGGGRVDAVVVSHEFTDRCHQATLLELEPSIPVFATSKAAALIRSWNHFETVYEIPVFSSLDEKEEIQQPLPEWLKINRVTSLGSDLAYYHSGILISWPGGNGETEGLVYTPHGLQPGSLEILNGRVRLLALLHGLHEVVNPWWLGIRALNLGAHKALESIRGIQPLLKYWVPTHDEVKTGDGLVSWVMSRFPWTLYDALEKKGFGEEKEWKLVKLGSGESLVLE